MFPMAVTDSVGTVAGDVAAGVMAEYPASVFPPYDRAQRRALRARLMAVASGAPASALALSALPEPGLYALAAALGDASSGEPGASGGSSEPGGAGDCDRRRELALALLAELRARNCRGMGLDPTGPARRGRLLQLIGSFSDLRVAGVSPLQRRRMAGGCPFCGAPDGLRVALASVRWRCFACGRGGGLLEFAEALLAQSGGGRG